MNFAITTPLSRITHEFLQVLVEALPDGQFAAWAVALPDCRVVAPSREEAIGSLDARLEERMARLEMIERPATLSNSIEHPAMKFAGMFKDDPEFAEIVAEMRAERELEAENPAYTMDW